MRQLQASKEGVAYVATPEAMLHAVLKDRRHIVIQAHLDLTTLPLRETSVCPEGCASPLPDIRGVESIRGNCSEAGQDDAVAAMVGNLTGAPLLPMRGTQCMLLTYEDALLVVSQHTWLDSLYIRFTHSANATQTRQHQYAGLTGISPLRTPSSADRWSGQHYITRSTFQGDGLGPTVGVWADQNTYIENCTFANLGGDAVSDHVCKDCSSAVNANNVSVTIVNSTFFDPVALPGSSYVRAWADSRVAISGCKFAPTPHRRLDTVPFYAVDSSTIYADRSGIRWRTENDWQVVAAPLLSTFPADPEPTERLLERSDPWLANITAELGEELPHQPAYPAPNTATRLRLPVAAPPLVPSPAPAPARSSSDPSTRLSVTAIAGGVAAGAFLLCAIVMCCVLWLRWRRGQIGQDPPPNPGRVQLMGGVSYEADVTTTGSTSGTDGASLPCEKIARKRSRGAPATYAMQQSAWAAAESVTAASPQPRAAQGGIENCPVMPKLPPGAALPEVLAFIHAQLDSIEPEVKLQEQFKLVGRGHRRTGGQSVVAFATGAFSREPYAFKFFPVRASFDRELALRRRTKLFPLMPKIQSVHDPVAPASENLPVTDRWGRSLPPCIVLARTESLAEWLLRSTPDIFQSVSVIVHIAACLREIHAAGYVHGAVKPAHIHLQQRQNRWALKDFDQTAAIGTVKKVDTVPSLPYVPPELVAAAAAGKDGILVDPSQDAWALGVVTFELLTGCKAHSGHEEVEHQIKEQLLGHAPLPWEGPRLTRKTLHSLGVFADLVLGLLRRDPVFRLSMTDFCEGCHDIVASHTSTAAPSNA